MSWTGFTEDAADKEQKESPGGRKAKSGSRKPREKLLAAAASLKTSSVVGSSDSSVVGSSDSLPVAARLTQPQPPTPVKMRVSGNLGYSLLYVFRRNTSSLNMFSLPNAFKTRNNYKKILIL